MNNVVCIRHPLYHGEESPDLSCKTCCEIYIAQILAESTSLGTNRKETAERWMIAKCERETKRNMDDESITFFI